MAGDHGDLLRLFHQYDPLSPQLQRGPFLHQEYLRLMKIYMIALASALALAQAACSSCLDMGCSRGAAVTLIAPADAASLDLRVKVGDREAVCTVSLPVTKDVECGTFDDRVVVQRSETSGAAFVVSAQEANGPFELEVKQSDVAIYSATLRPDYKVEPGSDDYCGGECKFATVTVDLTK